MFWSPNTSENPQCTYRDLTMFTLLLFFQVLSSKEIHAAGLKRRLGITAWREFSEDMQQGLKSIQVQWGTFCLLIANFLLLKIEVAL